MRISRLVIVSVALFSITALAKPNGSDIAAKAKGAKLDKGKAVAAKNKKGKTVKVTPVTTAKAKMTDQEKGHLIGTIDSQFPVSPAKLKPGSYDLYGAKVDGQWMVYFESGGKVVGESKMAVTKKGKTAGKAAFKHKPGKGKGKGPKGKKTDMFGNDAEPMQDAWEEFPDDGWYDVDGAYCWEDWDSGDVWCDDLEGLVCNSDTGECDEYEP